LTTFGQQPTPLLRADPSRKKIKKSPPHEKFLLPPAFGTFCFAAIARANPQAKQKEPNRQRFIKFRGQNDTFAYIYKIKLTHNI
jgi:hypothetical protein